MQTKWHIKEITQHNNVCVYKGFFFYHGQCFLSIVQQGFGKLGEVYTLRDFYRSSIEVSNDHIEL